MKQENKKNSESKIKSNSIQYYDFSTGQLRQKIL